MTAFVFPGQGAQHSGMCKKLCEESRAAAEIFKRAEEIMPGITGLCTNASDEELQRTENTQPAVFCTSLASAAALEERDIYADMTAGFSLGELSALTFAGVFTLEEGLRLVMERGRLMSLCAEKHKGAMAAVLRLDDETVEKLASGFTEIYPVNYNSDGQLAVAGNPEQLDEFSHMVAENGGRAVMLRVSGAFHSPYMNDAALGLSKYLGTLSPKKPRIPVYSNVTALAGGDPSELLPRQVCSPVLWKQSVRNMIADKAISFIEAAPGNVLTGLIKRIAPQIPARTAREVIES